MQSTDSLLDNVADAADVAATCSQYSGQLESELSDQDDVTFISTLHGG
jgi:Urm1 (Ubiquitin related modifier)